LICVFGCGGNRSKLRRYDMGEISGKMADLSVITADNSRFEKVEDIIEDIKIGMHKTDGEYVVIPDRREAIEYCIHNAKKDDMIVIVGKGHEDYQEIEGVRYHFSDREEAEKVLQERR
jgi:UDP-N-acetylmuramoyl-L-alanyl-D-glutamate--2,6-diaminopimelate ligase